MTTSKAKTTKTAGSEPQSQGLTKGEARSLAADAKKFGKAWSSAAKDDISARFALGDRALEVEKKYGRRGIEALAAEINRSPSYVYSYAAVARTWGLGHRRDLLSRTAGSGEWSHLVLLSNQKRVDAKKREELLKRIVAEKMSPTALKLELYPKEVPEEVDPDAIDDGFMEADADAESETGTAADPVTEDDRDPGDLEVGADDDTAKAQPEEPEARTDDEEVNGAAAASSKVTVRRSVVDRPQAAAARGVHRCGSRSSISFAG